MVVAQGESRMMCNKLNYLPLAFGLVMSLAACGVNQSRVVEIPDTDAFPVPGEVVPENAVDQVFTDVVPPLDTRLDPNAVLSWTSCDGVKDFDLKANLTEATQFEGMTVILATNEMDMNGGGMIDGDVFISTQIKKGQATIHCKNALEETYHYPGYFLLVDVDGDGVCSEGDYFRDNMYYGWDSDMELDFKGSGLRLMTNDNIGSCRFFASGLSGDDGN